MTEISTWSQYHTLAEEMANTPICEHVWSGRVVRGCAYCELDEAARHFENACARQARHAAPNRQGVQL